MNPNDLEALQLALLQELNDIEGVRGVATETDSDLVFLIYVDGDQCETAVKTRLDEYDEPPPYRLVQI